MLLNRCARACVAVAAVLPTNAFGASAATSANGLAAIPAGAVVRFHLTRSIASNRTPTGEPFSFMLLDPIGGTTIVSGGPRALEPSSSPDMPARKVTKAT